MLEVISLFTVGGLVISVLAGTSLVRYWRLWWLMALFVAATAAILNALKYLRVVQPAVELPDLSDFLWEFCVVAVSMLFVAAIARIGYRLRLPRILRAAACLVTDLTIHLGPADAVFIIFCGFGNCDV